MVVNSMTKCVGDSFIGWLGGKTTLRPTIINCIPKHHCYVEVFGGSATVFFGKPPKLSKIEVINDVHKELVNLMHVLSGTYFDEKVRQEFIEYVRSMPAARDAFERWKHWEDDDLDKLNSAQRAFIFYYCVKKGFSSTPTGGYEASPFSNSRYNQRTDFDKFTKRFQARNAQIERLDFRDLIDKYNDHRSDTFFFLDPPYFVANDTNYYKHVFNAQDHQDLKNRCDSIHENKNKFLITYDDVTDVENLYKDYFVYRTDPIIYRASDEKEKRELSKTELFITNYDIAKMIRLQNNQDIFDKVTTTDNRIDFPGHIGLDRIS